MAKRSSFLLLDANVIIHLFEVGLEAIALSRRVSSVASSRSKVLQVLNSTHERAATEDGQCALETRRFFAMVSRLITEWAEERRTEIEEAWQCAVAGKEVPWVPPLQ